MGSDSLKFEYFIYPALKELANARDPERRLQLRALIAANIYSPELLNTPVEGLDVDQLLALLSPEPEKSDEDLIIDSFIEKFGKPGQKELDSPLLPDTAEGLLPQDKTVLDTPVAQENDPKDQSSLPPRKEEKNVDDWLETVKKMVKNADYRGAIAFINEKYLNNPEKSIYFADQIRFIKKMMLNEERKSN